ncbi:DUF3040 domain-containing protein [Amycolatopsis sp., V23-08]|uniref:DUF3040 domain-containing protein n=1 Tax=Amycolatopsis heterodermiae TaxID=3110235 RepID=A0ABU5RLD6_9PSEU|nr:DUF3040 domain-containing protein [Amycolatopsis sp., V23-08]MEA5367111.1 DUF3040 domain-containing protein [Amycolatopsis sp., V23-08]
MLHDHERRALERIEAEITATDPTFADRLRRPLTSWRFVLMLVAITGVCALAVGIFADQVTLALVGVVTVAVFVMRRFSRRTGTTGE